MIASGTTNDNEWQRMTSSGTTTDNEWCYEWQRVTRNGTASDVEWQRVKKLQWVTTSDKTNEYGWK